MIWDWTHISHLQRLSNYGTARNSQDILLGGPAKIRNDVFRSAFLSKPFQLGGERASSLPGDQKRLLEADEIRLPPEPPNFLSFREPCSSTTNRTPPPRGGARKEAEAKDEGAAKRGQLRVVTRRARSCNCTSPPPWVLETLCRRPCARGARELLRFRARPSRVCPRGNGGWGDDCTRSARPIERINESRLNWGSG